MNRADTHFYPRVFALGTAAVLGIALFKILQPFGEDRMTKRERVGAVHAAAEGLMSSETRRDGAV